MLREFIKCNSLSERIHVIESSVPADWNQSELNTVLRIVGVSEEVKGMDTQEILNAIEKALSDKLTKELADHSETKEITRLAEETAPKKNDVSYIEYLGRAAAVSNLTNRIYP